MKCRMTYSIPPHLLLEKRYPVVPVVLFQIADHFNAIASMYNPLSGRAPKYQRIRG